VRVFALAMMLVCSLASRASLAGGGGQAFETYPPPYHAAGMNSWDFWSNMCQETFKLARKD
jgi:hypothetical protein